MKKLPTTLDECESWDEAFQLGVRHEIAWFRSATDEEATKRLESAITPVNWNCTLEPEQTAQQQKS
jgi:hypothetical protein